MVSLLLPLQSRELAAEAPARVVWPRRCPWTPSLSPWSPMGPGIAGTTGFSHNLEHGRIQTITSLTGLQWLLMVLLPATVWRLLPSTQRPVVPSLAGGGGLRALPQTGRSFKKPNGAGQCLCIFSCQHPPNSWASEARAPGWLV